MSSSLNKLRSNDNEFSYADVVMSESAAHSQIRKVQQNKINNCNIDHNSNQLIVLKKEKGY